MSTLYQSATNARKIIFVILIMILLILGYDVGSGYLKSTPETVLEAQRFYMTADKAFGNVGVPKITSFKIDSDNNASYLLQNFHGSFPDVAYVYKIEQPKEKLLSFEEALKTAETLGFEKNSYADLGSNNFQWQTQNSTKTLKYNKVSQIWEMNTDYVNNVNAIARKVIDTPIENYASRVKSLVNKLGFETSGFPNGKVELRYVSLGFDGSFETVERSADASYIIADVFRQLDLADLKPSGEQPKPSVGEEVPKPFDGYVYTSDPRKGQIRFVISNNLSDYSRDIFDLEFTNYEYSTLRAKYFIISADEAWTKIQRGQASLVLLQPQGDDYFSENAELNVRRYVADARRTELAYWEPETWDGFVYPIYIIRGRAELEDGRQASFEFYVDALKRSE